MSARPYHKRYHSDALAGFMSLTLEERGAYQTLLDMMYDRGGPVPDNERLLAGYMGVSLRKWKSIRADLIAKGKISATDDGYLTNSRFEKERENDAKTTRKLSENGLKGARKKHENEKKANENNETDMARPQQNSGLIPEARSQKLEKSNNNQHCTTTPREPDNPDPDAKTTMQIVGWAHMPADLVSQLRKWRDQGFRFDYHVEPALKAVAARLASQGKSPPQTLKYFDQAVQQEAAEWGEELHRTVERWGMDHRIVQDLLASVPKNFPAVRSLMQ